MKFKIGDILIAIRNYSPYLTKGKPYIITDIHRNGCNVLYSIWDDGSKGYITFEGASTYFSIKNAPRTKLEQEIYELETMGFRD